MIQGRVERKEGGVGRGRWGGVKRGGRDRDAETGRETGMQKWGGRDRDGETGSSSKGWEYGGGDGEG